MIKIKTPEEIIKEYRKVFKKDYLGFIYAETMMQMCEFALRTSTNLFCMDMYGILDSENVQKIRTFMLDNLRTNQEWKKKLVRFPI